MNNLGTCPACDVPGAAFFPDGADQRVDCPDCGELFLAYEAELDDARALVMAGDPARAVIIAQEVLGRVIPPDPKSARSIYDRIEARLRDRGSPDLRFQIAGTARVLERYVHPKGSADATADEARQVISVVDLLLAPRTDVADPKNPE